MIFKKHSSLQHNISVHDKIARKYEQIHGEIYNEVEQTRLSNSIKNALSYIKTKGAIKRVIDFGCGAGNLTKHLSSQGCDVVACDVSQGFLDLVSSKNMIQK
jgi:2-polyprenyl-3-methyl-5-hydroxy-6-metoxy-1,4-benzoquinol methylase